MRTLIMALAAGAILAFASEANAQDPRIGRMITLLERMDERMASMEDRIRVLEGGHRPSYSAPATYQHAVYQPAVYRAAQYRSPSYEGAFNAGYRDGMRSYATPVKYVDESTNYGGATIPVSLDGGGRTLVIRIVLE